MRAMILAAGRGERMRPLSESCPKAALLVHGIPLIAYNLALLAAHGVREVIVNLHHLAEKVREAAEQFCPIDLKLHFSLEHELLNTGGGIRRATPFLSQSDPCLVLASDMLLDYDLGSLVERHRSQGDAVTLLLRENTRAAAFSTIGIDAAGKVRRIARRFDLAGEVQQGVYVSVTVIAARALKTFPQRERFNHLDDWLAPLLRAGADDIRGEIAAPGDCFWQPVGTPEEYWEANSTAHVFQHFDVTAIAARGSSNAQRRKQNS